jgi:ribosomal protein S27AE
MPAVALERRGHLLGHQIEEGTFLRCRRHDVIERRERTLGKCDAPSMLAQHVERLRCRDFVNKV